MNAEYLFLAWVLFSIPILIIGASYRSYKTDDKYSVGACIFVALVVFVAPFWGIYFLIRALWHF
jgi:hypothetical protein